MTQSNNSGGSRKVKRVATSGSAAAKTALSVDSEVTKFWVKCAGHEDDLTADMFTKLFDPLSVNAANVDCFIFVYLLQCKGCWKITKQDFEQGCAASGMKPNSKSVGSAIEASKKQFQRDASEFMRFFGFVFSFCRNSVTATIIPTEDAIPTMEVCLSASPRLLYPKAKLFDYLGAHQKAMSSDLWKQSAKFLLEIKPDYSNYDEMACWNSVIDDFVEAQKG